MTTTFDPSAPAAHDGIYGLPFTPEESRVVLVPVPWEATVSYGSGTAEGPAAILKASRQVDLRDRETGRPYEAGIAMLPISDEERKARSERLLATLAEIEAMGPGETDTEERWREFMRGIDEGRPERKLFEGQY